MGRSERTKGHKFEREVARGFVEAGYLRACRQLEYQENTAFGVDLDGTGVYLVQCKNRKQYVSVATSREIRVEAYRKWKGIDEAVPLLVTKAERQPVMAVLHWNHLLKLLKLERQVENGKNPQVDWLSDETPSREEISERAEEIRKERSPEGWEWRPTEDE